MTEKKLPDEFFSLRQAADYGNVSRQAIYSAIHKGKLKAVKQGNNWKIRRDDYDEYRLDRHNREKSVIGGEKVFDEAKGHYSIMFVSKALSAALGRPYPPQHLYYLIRTGQIEAFKKGSSWIIAAKDAQELYEKEMGIDDCLRRFS